MQKMTSRMGVDGKTGIYRIRVKVEGGNGYLDYVGQAVNIKERWYEHVKKMVGADACGNEHLYNGGWLPSDCWWDVLEEVEGGKKERDERERYWIDYYGDLNR